MLEDILSTDGVMIEPKSFMHFCATSEHRTNALVKVAGAEGYVIYNESDHGVGAAKIVRWKGRGPQLFGISSDFRSITREHVSPAL